MSREVAVVRGRWRLVGAPPGGLAPGARRSSRSARHWLWGSSRPIGNRRADEAAARACGEQRVPAALRAWRAHDLRCLAVVHGVIAAVETAGPRVRGAPVRRLGSLSGRVARRCPSPSRRPLVLGCTTCGPSRGPSGRAGSPWRLPAPAAGSSSPGPALCGRRSADMRTAWQRGAKANKQ